MRFLIPSALVALAALLSAPALADAPCAKGQVCASDPDGVAATLRDLGYSAKLTVHEASGDPMIESAAAGYNFVINFNDCTASKACKSLGFLIVFKDDGKNTPELANKWNKAKRFAQMAANDNGSLAVSYDVTTVGGLTRANFADIIDWWQTLLGQLPAFFSENG